MKEIRLHLNGRTVPLHIRRTRTTRSPHSGRELTELHGWVTTADAELNGWLAEVLHGVGEEPVRASDPEGEFAGKWCVSWNSYAESGGVHTYTLILREDEELSLEALVVDGRELYPYEYREEPVDGELLTIRAKLVGTEEDLFSLRALLAQRTLFSVVRRGIHDEPREMRLGVAEWSQNEEQVKYRLVLVDRALEAAPRSELVRIQEENSHAALGFYANLTEHLTELLVARGVLSREEVEEIREAARSQVGVARHELWRVPDIDLL